MQVNRSETHAKNDHSHRLSRATLQLCNECGGFFVTRYKESENGDLVLEELELEVKIKSTQIGQPGLPKAPSKCTVRENSSIAEAREETCW
jgi:hypothetical protein